MKLHTALTVAGSDSGGGAGIQADLKTFSANGVFGMSAITAITAQNSQTVTAIQNVDTDVIAKQIDAVFQDFPVDAVKIGMLSNEAIIRTVVMAMRKWKPDILVVDPVMISKSGCQLLEPSAEDALRQDLLPLATIITPNVSEAEVLAGMDIRTKDDFLRAAGNIIGMGTQAVILKAGGCADHADDLFADRCQTVWLPGTRLQTRNSHGTGCTLSSAITAMLAKGENLLDACRHAKDFVSRAMAAELELGHGCRPLHHFVNWY